MTKTSMITGINVYAADVIVNFNSLISGDYGQIGVAIGALVLFFVALSYFFRLLARTG